MITYEQALAKVREYLEDSYVPVQIVRAEEFSEGWYFCYESVEYMETENFSSRLVGNGPLLVDRETGEMYVLGTSKPVKHSVEDYVRQKHERENYGIS
jgi:hypothetical protein